MHSPDAQPFWDGAKQHRLLLKRCAGCGHIHFPPRHLCPACWSGDLGWIESGGKGSIYSFTVVRRAPNAEFAEKVPYALALVELAEGPRLIANVSFDASGRPLQIGDPVAVYFEERDGGVTLPQFRRVEGAG